MSLQLLFFDFKNAVIFGMKRILRLVYTQKVGGSSPSSPSCKSLHNNMLRKSCFLPLH